MYGTFFFQLYHISYCLHVQIMITYFGRDEQSQDIKITHKTNAIAELK